MTILERFMAYAQDFERTFHDDDWSRLAQYFAPDATYEVRNVQTPCVLRGRDAIFRGIKKSLDGFDRKFAKRDIEVTNGPEISDEGMRLGWKVVYSKTGLPPFVLRGQSSVRYANGKIAYLCDAYEPSVAVELAAWRRESGVAIDPSYT